MGFRFRLPRGFDMYWKALLIAGSIAPLSGCLLAEHTARNLFNEPTELLDNKKITRQLRHESRAVWQQVCQQHPARTFTADFVDGFQDGYCDYLESGGTAQPPAVPPVKYRRSRYMSVEGHAQIQDYFCGFKYGMDIAVVSGKRELITVPILLPEPPPQPPVQARQVPLQAVPRMPEPLPAPKPVEKSSGLPLLDRPLASLPLPTSQLPVDAPTVSIPVIDPPGGKPEATPKFTSPVFDFPMGPRSDLAVPGPILPAGYAVHPGSNPVAPPPLREIPNAIVRPERNLQDAMPIPPWRGY